MWIGLRSLIYTPLNYIIVYECYKVLSPNSLRCEIILPLNVFGFTIGILGGELFNTRNTSVFGDNNINSNNRYIYGIQNVALGIMYYIQNSNQ